MMQYTLFLWPHANARYQVEMEKLARAELEIMLSRMGVEHNLLEEGLSGVPSIRFETQRALDHEQVRLLSRHSLIYVLFQVREDGALVPVSGREESFVGADLAGILKYKGKTNELFTQLLVNMAWLSGSMPEKARLLDPMCGRGTTLFVALNRGWDAFGSDIDHAGLREAENFFKRYAEYHRFKHRLTRGSLTLANKKSAPYAEFSIKDRRLRLSEMDARRVAEAYGRGKFDIVCADLPYGVQHGANMPLESLLRMSLPAWRETLVPGGAIALAFNAQTLPMRAVRALLSQAGMRVLEGGPYDKLEHWVEQAVTRDVAVAVRA